MTSLSVLEENLTTLDEIGKLLVEKTQILEAISRVIKEKEDRLVEIGRLLVEKSPNNFNNDDVTREAIQIVQFRHALAIKLTDLLTLRVTNMVERINMVEQTSHVNNRLRQEKN